MEDIQEFLKQLGGKISDSFETLNPFSDRFFGKGLFDGIGKIFNLLNPFSDDFFLKEVYRVLFEVDKGLLEGLKNSLDMPLLRSLTPSKVGGFRVDLAGHVFAIDIPNGVDIFVAGCVGLFGALWLSRALPQMFSGEFYDI